MMARDAAKNAQHQEIRDMAAKMMKDQQKRKSSNLKRRQEWYSETRPNGGTR